MALDYQPLKLRLAFLKGALSPVVVVQLEKVEAVEEHAVVVCKKLNDVAAQAMKTPAVRERLETLGAVIVSPDRATPEYLGPFLKSEIEKWASPIKASGVTVD